MFISISKSFKKIFGFRLSIGKRLHGSSAAIAMIFVGIFYLCYFSIAISLWLLCFSFWLFFYLPIKCIINLVNKWIAS